MDVDREVHKAPANQVVPEWQHNMLNPRGVNGIRDFRPDIRSGAPAP
jgi:hypothetical protein